MRWRDLWIAHFGTAESFEIDLGFWIGLFLVMIIAILMNFMYWTMTLKRKL